MTAGRYEAHADHGLSADLGRAVSIFLDVPAVVQRGEPLPIRVTLVNTGAGHAVPTGSPFVGLRVDVQAVLDDGTAVGEPFQHILQRHVSEDPPYTIGEDTRLMPGATLELEPTLELPQKGDGGPGAIEVRLVRISSDGTENIEHTRRFGVEVR